MWTLRGINLASQWPSPVFLCCLTSFPLLLHLVRDPVLPCANEDCVRRAAPLGIQAPHTSEKQRGMCISILYCSLEPSCRGTLCVFAVLSALQSNVLSWTTASEILLCVFTHLYLLLLLFCITWQKKKKKCKIFQPFLHHELISSVQNYFLKNSWSHNIYGQGVPFKFWCWLRIWLVNVAA